jgi:hypothetical protein
MAEIDEALPNDDNPDCTDPLTGLYLSFEGVISSPCPCCGQENMFEVTVPTNRFRFHCLCCGEEYTTCMTLGEQCDGEL